MSLVEELKSIVEWINCQIASISTSSEEFYVNLETNGLDYIITFLGTNLWSSVEDDRDYITEKDCYEPLYPFIIRKYNETIDNLQLQKIKE
jgi:hypothetical protein